MLSKSRKADSFNTAQQSKELLLCDIIPQSICLKGCYLSKRNEMCNILAGFECFGDKPCETVPWERRAYTK